MLHSEKGSLYIFTSYAPGAGKTSMMLKHGIQRKQNGESVIIGFINHVKRPFTESLINELDSDSSNSHGYSSISTGYLDINYICKLHPDCCVVDEIMFRNKLGGNFLYSDIERILCHKIDVLASVSMLRFRSVSDFCAKVSGVRPRKLLPDYIVDLATKIYFVDVPPIVVSKRYKEDNFFRSGGTAWKKYTSEIYLPVYRQFCLKYLSDLIGVKYEIIDGF